MSQNIVFNGVVYSVPAVGDDSWGQSLSDYLIAIPQGALQKSGGIFTLAADVNFGPNYGILSKSYSTRTVLPAQSGILRLSLADTIAWRNNANNADLSLAIDGSNNLTFNGSVLQAAGNYITALTGDVTATGPGSVAATITPGVIANSHVNASAAIAYSKLNLASAIVNADISTSALIDLAKLAQIPTANFLGRTTAGTGVVESLTAAQAAALLPAFVGDAGSGGTKGLVPAPASGDGALTKVLRADGTWGAAGTASPLTTKGDVYTYSTVNARLGVGSNGQVLTADSTQTNGIKWATPFGAGAITVDRYSGDGTTTGFTLSVDPGTINNTNVYINGVYQQKNTYSVSTTTLTFTTAPPSGTNNIEVDSGSTAAIGTPSDGTVTTIKIADANVTRAKFATGAFLPPTIQKFTSGSGTYTTAAGALYIRVKMVGAGGGGGGGGTGSPVVGGTGGTSTFGSSLLVANGGTGGATNNTSSNGVAGGTASLGTGPIGTALTGGGSGGTPGSGTGAPGGIGGSSYYGGAGTCGGNYPGGAGATNTGGGGGGGGSSVTAAGTGGGAGGFVDALITTPSATYAYAVGAAGTAGAAGTSGQVGGAGGSGYIEVTEYYN